jgi:hypothetical protein
MSNAYNHCYTAMRNWIVEGSPSNPNKISEIKYISIYCEEQKDGSYIEYFFGDPQPGTVINFEVD